MTQVQNEQTQIEQLIGKYIEGINGSSVDILLPLFTQDGVFMAPDVPTMNGHDQIRAFFNRAFTAIKLDAKIYFDEVVTTENDAYARTHSLVNVTMLEKNETHIEENRELFICRKDDGRWKIARYMFNKLPNAA